MFHYLVTVREYSSYFSVLSSLTLTFSGPGSPNQSCSRQRLPHAIGGRHVGPGTCRSTTAQRADMQPELHQTPLTRRLIRQVAALTQQVTDRAHSRAREPDNANLGSPAHTPHSGFTLAIAGLHANNAPRQRSIPPNRRPIQPKEPFLDSFHPMGLQFGHNTTANCELSRF